jgi:SIR2-like domain
LRELVPQNEIDSRALEHARMVMEAMLVDGQVVPLLGAGVNLCGRQPEQGWEAGQVLPNGEELAALLARKVPGYPPSVLEDLLRVSQCVDHKRGWKVLYMTLHDLFDADYEPSDLHRLLAGMPKLMASLERPPRETHLLLVTTNYDDVLERALNDAGEEYDLVWYVARGEQMGNFMHKPPNEDARVIGDPDQYVEPLNLAERSVVLKIHGAVDRPSGDNDSYVITEDNYIDYLTRTDIRKLIPKGLAAKLRNSNILFLGYSMRDWNLRAIFRRVWLEEKLGWKSWAIRRPLDPLPLDQADDPVAQKRQRQNELEQELEEAFWDDRGVDIFDVDLTIYTHALEQAARELVTSSGNP